MTTSRIVRGNKGRIFAYVVAVVFITGIIACYNNTLSQLDEARLGKEVCQRESENLSTQLQMISDYKQRLEKSLKTEKAEHTQSKKELQAKLDEEKKRNENTASQISSLQQNYNLLQTQHEDSKQKCADTQQEQATEIDQLQAMLKTAQEELRKVKIDKENLKSDYAQLHADKTNLEQQIRNTHSDTSYWQSEINRLTKENNELKRMLQDAKGMTEAKTLETLSAPSESSRKTESSTNFSKQVSPDDAVNQIFEDKNKPADQNVADQPPANNDNPPHAPRNEPNEGVLPMPSGQNAPSKRPTRSSSKASLDEVLPLKKSLTVTPENAKEKFDMMPLPYKKAGGVVIPKKDHLEEIQDAFPNRYRNEVLENERVNEEEAKKSEQAAARIEEAEKDNVAHEEIDFPAAPEDKIKLEGHHHINDLGIADGFKDDNQERVADPEHFGEEDDDDDVVNEPAIRN